MCWRVDASEWPFDLLIFGELVVMDVSALILGILEGSQLITATLPMIYTSTLFCASHPSDSHITHNSPLGTI